MQDENKYNAVIHKANCRTYNFSCRAKKDSFDVRTPCTVTRISILIYLSPSPRIVSVYDMEFRGLNQSITLRRLSINLNFFVVLGHSDNFSFCELCPFVCFLAHMFLYLYRFELHVFDCCWLPTPSGVRTCIRDFRNHPNVEQAAYNETMLFVYDIYSPI